MNILQIKCDRIELIEIYFPLNHFYVLFVLRPIKYNSAGLKFKSTLISINYRQRKIILN